MRNEKRPSARLVLRKETLRNLFPVSTGVQAGKAGSTIVCRGGCQTTSDK